jgi:hypothetical protein
LNTVTKNDWAVVHFYHKDFEKCKIMDHHLNIIAKIHPETVFVSLDAEKAPFFVTKLAIRFILIIKFLLIYIKNCNNIILLELSLQFVCSKKEYCKKLWLVLKD